MHALKRTFSLILAGAISVSMFINVAGEGQTLKEQLNDDNDYGVSFEYIATDDFAAVRNMYAENGYKSADIDNPVTISAASYSSSGKELAPISYRNKNNVILWDSSNPFIEWNVQVPKSGIYTFKMEYIAEGTGISAVTRSLKIDGKSCYSEAEELSFYRLFKEEGRPVVNSLGDEVAPDVNQYYDWQWQDFVATDASYDGALQFYMTEGTHSIRMETVSGSLYLSELQLCAVKELPSYKEVYAGYKDAGYKEGSDYIRFEAESSEHTLYKNSSTMRCSNNGDPGTTPFSYGKTRINVFGGTMWQGANSSVTYQFEVKSAGLYMLSMRTLMNFRDGIPSYRSIAIDGEIPYKEWESYKFIYNKNWRGELISDDNGKPYYIYLEPGKHTLTMAVKQGELSAITSVMEKDSNALSQLMLKVKMIVGQNPDTNYDYELDKQIPNLIPTFNSLIDDMKQCMTAMEAVCGYKQSKYYQLKSFITQLEVLIKDPFVIPGRISSIEEIITSYGSWLNEMQNHPLTLDYIEVIPSADKQTVSTSNFFERFYASVVNFTISFTKDYNNISVKSTADTEIKSTISVWVSRGTKWCNTMKQLIDSEFTPKTGIAVNLNVLPAGQLNSGGANALLLSITSGRAPDLATGVASGSIGEFAMRNALADVSSFKDYEEVSKSFMPEHFVPLSYNGGVYALPETQNFACMIYRKDIFSELGLSVPNTWTEVYDKIIPVLNQNNMQFYVPLTQEAYSIFLFQYGGGYYHDDLKKTGLDTPEAYLAMKEFSELFTLYGIPKAASFYNRFRNGEMPIGIVDYATYMTVKVAASDLKGKWGLSLIPGHENQDGSVNRSHGYLASESCMIMEQSKNRDEAWEFMKWWTSHEVQLDYANRLESLMGVSARWATANSQAFNELAWNTEEFSVIEKSYESVQQIPVVLGGYYTGRHITNALNRIVVSGINTRDSLETAVEDINRELRRRRESVS